MTTLCHFMTIAAQHGLTGSGQFNAKPYAVNKDGIKGLIV